MSTPTTTTIQAPQSGPVETARATAAARGPTKKYRLLTGKHTEGKNPDGTQRVYNRGDIIETWKDLMRLNHPSSPKFELVPDDVPPRRAADTPPAPAQAPAPVPAPTPRRQGTETLDTMNVEELRKFAESEEINLKGVANTKEALIKAIRQQMIS